jgi:hypothetical protein
MWKQLRPTFQKVLKIRFEKRIMRYLRATHYPGHSTGGPKNYSDFVSKMTNRKQGNYRGVLAERY